MLPGGDRSGLWGPGGHAAATGVLVGAGVLGSAAAGAPAAEVGAGAGLAWAIQAAALWRLVDALGEGRSATRPWVAGMAARLAGLGVVAVLGWGTGLEGEPAAVAYVGAVIPLLWLEGLWLNRAAGSAWPTTAGSPDPTADRTAAGQDGPDETRAMDEPTDGT